jgi:methionine aminopeptidase
MPMVAGLEFAEQIPKQSLVIFSNRFNLTRFKKNSVVAIETFISTTSTSAETLKDGWTWLEIKEVLWHNTNTLLLLLMENRLC